MTSLKQQIEKMFREDYYLRNRVSSIYFYEFKRRVVNLFDGYVCIKRDKLCAIDDVILLRSKWNSLKKIAENLGKEGFSTPKIRLDLVEIQGLILFVLDEVKEELLEASK